MRVLICAIFLTPISQGCGEGQTPPETQPQGMVVRGNADDIPVYDPKTSGKIVDPQKFGESYARAFRQFDAAVQIEAYNSEHGHYPKDYAEFKTGVIEPNNLKFPDNLPMGFQAQYDVENHRVVIVSGKQGSTGTQKK